MTSKAETQKTVTRTIHRSNYGDLLATLVNINAFKHDYNWRISCNDDKLKISITGRRKYEPIGL